MAIRSDLEDLWGARSFVFCEKLLGYFCDDDLLSFLLAVLTRVEAIWVAMSRLGILCERCNAACTLAIAHLVDLASGDVVQLVRTLPSNRMPFFSYT